MFNMGLLTKNIIKTFKTEGDELVKLMKNKLDTTNSNASGKLKKSIKKDVRSVKEIAGFVSLEISGNDYGFFKDEGRKAGKFPPSNAIKKWIKQKGITAKNITEKSLIFLIQRKIGQKGFKGINFIKESLDVRKHEIFKNLSIATKKDIELDIQRFTKKDFFITKQ